MRLTWSFRSRKLPLTPCRSTIFHGSPTAEIGDAIRKQVGLFTGEAPEGGAMIDEMTAVIENLLASKKIKGNVTHQLLAAPIGDGMMMQFRVEGVPLRIQSVQFGDALATNSERLKDRVPDIKGQPYSRFAVEVFENEHVRPLYASKGFLRAQIGPPQAQLDSRRERSQANRAWTLSIPITPGPGLYVERRYVAGKHWPCYLQALMRSLN